MIFKAEEPNIKRIATEARESARESRPLDYRTEITKEQLEMVQDTYYRDAVERGDWKEFADYGRLLKHLNLPIPRISKKDRNRLRTKLNQDLQKPIRQISAHDIFALGRNFSRLVQLDPTHLELLNSDSKQRLLEIKKEWENLHSFRLHGWEFFANYGILNPNDPILPPPNLKDTLPTVVQGLVETKKNWVNTLHALQKLADARIAGAELPELTAIDWRVVREKAYEASRDQTIHLFRFMLYTRIIRAESITVDENGLHIVDSKPLPAAQAAAPRPTSRHL